ncbi:hypothetical protein [Streptomyces parvus]|uniref:hypothetical protein n=1 Tax=Streptomyces parvus TaxID=66428 RepID=UPI0033223664|nr:hypothetical protein [Streptomyces globisporus]
MPRHVLAATRVDGREIAREERPAAPSLTVVAAYGDLHDCDYVTVSQGESVGLYARDPGGTWGAVSPGTDAVTTDRDALPPEAPARRILVECTDCGAPGRPEALPDGLCRPCRSHHTSGATEEQPADPRDTSDAPGTRDIGAYVAELRNRFKAP